MVIKNKVLVILAGGRSSRFGKIADAMPKFLLPFNNTNLLEKQINYAREAGIQKIIVSTLPKFVPIIKNYLRVKNIKIEILPNHYHAISSFSGLAQVIRKKRFKIPIIVSLSDIYFVDNPFFDIEDNSPQTCLYLSRPIFKTEIRCGGIAFLQNNVIKKLIAEPTPILLKKFCLRWNGLCTLSLDDQKILLEYVKNKTHDFPEEDFFNYLLSLKKIIRYKLSVDFINNNLPQDLFLSSLYDFAKNVDLSKNNKILILKVANIVRKNLHDTHYLQGK